MADNFHDTGKDATSTKTTATGAGDGHAPRLVKWEEESLKSNVLPMKQADATQPPPPGYLTVHFDPAKGLDKAVGPDVQHLTIDSDKGINLATNLIYGKDNQGREIAPHYHTVIGQPDDKGTTQLRGQFDVSPNLQDITLHYTDAKGLVHNKTFPASTLRVEGAAGAINPYVNDFKKPEPTRPTDTQYPGTTSIYEFGYKLSDISGKALGFLERQLMDEKARDKTGNPYIDINLAETRVGLAMKHYMNAGSPQFDIPTRQREKGYAMDELAAARQNYDSAVDLGQKQMRTLPNAGDVNPHNYNDPLGRRFAPQRPYGEDYYPQVYGSAIDTANWRRIQLKVLQDIMSVNGTLPPRQSSRIDQP